MDRKAELYRIIMQNEGHLKQILLCLSLTMLWNEDAPYRPDISCMEMALHPAEDKFPTFWL